ncbi:MAG: carbohydrate kinase [Balneolales bacterium]
MTKPVIVGLGEILWDIFPDYKSAGGAPMNVAVHATQLGNDGVPASRVGNDENGKELMSLLASRSVNTAYIQKDDQAPTGTVEISIKGGEAIYTFPDNVAWDRLALTPAWLDLANQADVICFGTLAQRNHISRKTIREFLSHASKHCIKIADLNFRQPHYSQEVVDSTLDIANVVKLNLVEWQQLSGMFGIDDLAEWLFSHKNVQIICLTKGNDGAELITPDRHLVEPAHPADINNGDSVGVGDAFTACLAHHLLRKSPLDICIKAANKYASQVATRNGAIPDLPASVIESVTGAMK